MSNPSISVVIPAYNHEKFIKETIESILNQTFEDFELIIIDDRSTDKTAQLIKEFSDKRIRFYENDENKGIFHNRSLGVNLAKGKYIALLDSDDLMYPNRLQVQYDFLEKNSDTHYCGSLGTLIDDNSVEIGELNKVTGTLNATLLFANQIINPAVMFRRSILEKVGGYENFSPAEDYHYTLKVVFNNLKIVNLNERLVKYRVHSYNTSSNTENLIRAEKSIAHYIHNKIGYPENAFSGEIHVRLIRQQYDDYSFNTYAKYLISLKKYYFQNSIFTESEFHKEIYNQIKKVHLYKKRKKSSLRLKLIKLLYF